MKKMTLLLFLIFSIQSWATGLMDRFIQNQSISAPVKESAVQTVHPDSPRMAMKILIESLKKEDWKTAIKYVDVRHLPQEDRLNTAMPILRKLKYVFGRFYWFDEHTISIKPLGEKEEGLPYYREFITTIKVEENELIIYLDKIRSKTSFPGWKLSYVTIRGLDHFYQKVGYGLISEFLPLFFFEYRPLQLPLIFWPFLIILIIILHLASGPIVSAFIKLPPIIYRQIEKKKIPIKLGQLKRPLRFLTTILFSFGILSTFNLPKTVQKGIKTLFVTLITIALIYLSFKCIDLLYLMLEERINSNKKKNARTTLFGRGPIKIFILIFFGLMILQNWGFNITAIFAGLGVGGIAVALAGQKTIENLFGGAVLLTDRPIKIGDFGKFGEYTGTIEEIGLRSTRVRTLDRTVVSIPNAVFSQLNIENYRRRDQIRFYKIIGVRYETTPNQIRYLLVELKKLLLQHPKVSEDPCRVRFINYNSFSLDIEIFGYIETTDWSDFLAIQEDLMLRIMEKVNECGTSFAFPSSTIYFERGQPLNKEKQKEINLAIQKQIEEGSLFLPEFPDEKVPEYWNKLHYP